MQLNTCSMVTIHLPPSNQYSQPMLSRTTQHMSLLKVYHAPYISRVFTFLFDRCSKMGSRRATNPGNYIPSIQILLHIDTRSFVKRNTSSDIRPRNRTSGDVDLPASQPLACVRERHSTTGCSPRSYSSISQEMFLSVDRPSAYARPSDIAFVQ